MSPTNCPTTPTPHPWKIVFAREPVLSGTTTTHLLTNNLCSYLILDTLPFAKKTIHWYCDLLLNHKKVNDMTEFDNGILIAYGMCPPCKLQEYYQLDPEHAPTHFMRGTADKVWGRNTHEVMYTRADDWTDWMKYSGKILFFVYSLFICLAFHGTEN